MGPEEPLNFGPQPDDERDAFEEQRIDPRDLLRVKLRHFIGKQFPEGEVSDYADNPEFLWPAQLKEQLEAAREYIYECNQKLSTIDASLELQVHAALEINERSFLGLIIQTRHASLEEKGQERFAVPVLPPEDQVRFASDCPDLFLEQFERPVLVVSHSTDQWRRGNLPEILLLEPEFKALVAHAQEANKEAAVRPEDSRTPAEIDTAHRCLLDLMIRAKINEGVYVNEGREFDIDDDYEYEPQQPKTPVLIQQIVLDQIDEDYLDASVEGRHRISGSGEHLCCKYSVGVSYDDSTGATFLFGNTAGMGRVKQSLPLAM